MGSESTRKVDIGIGTGNSEDGDDEKKSEIKYDENEDDSDYEDLCVICFGKWTKEGVHMATRLPCGHVFGFRVWKPSMIALPPVWVNLSGLRLSGMREAEEKKLEPENFLRPDINSTRAIVRMKVPQGHRIVKELTLEQLHSAVKTLIKYE